MHDVWRRARPGAVVAIEVGEPEVHRRRGKWVVRQSGYDPATGRRKVRQVGTFATKRQRPRAG